LKVAYDTRPTADADGIGRYSRCLLAALKQTAAAADEVMEADRPSSMLRSRSADVLHAPWMGGAMLHSPCPMVVTVHDVAAQKRRSEHLRTGVRQRLRQLAVQRALRVIVPTAAVAADAQRHLDVDAERLAVIPHAADAAMRPRSEEEMRAVRSRFKLPERYLVWVGSLEHPDPGKHLAALAATPRELPLVLVGATRPWAHELPDVTLTGQVSDEELAAIYTGAHALVLSSEHEGFGLSGIEALACGTPVVACRAPALVEVLGERATLVDPCDMQALLTAAEGAARPAPAPPAWSWHDAARATWSVYASALTAAEELRSSTRASRRRRAASATPAPASAPAPPRRPGLNAP